MIGIDYAELHFSIRDVHGQPGEPVARLTPLGWTYWFTEAGRGQRAADKFQHGLFRSPAKERIELCIAEVLGG